MKGAHSATCPRAPVTSLTWALETQPRSRAAPPWPGTHGPLGEAKSLPVPGWRLLGGCAAHSPVDAALALQVFHACSRVPYHLQQSLHPQAGSLGPKEGQEVASWQPAREALLSLQQGCRPSWAAVPTPGDQPPRLTLHELHDNVDRLLLGADANQTHDVGVAVLLQDPGVRGYCC